MFIILDDAADSHYSGKTLEEVYRNYTEDNENYSLSDLFFYEAKEIVVKATVEQVLKTSIKKVG